MIVTISGASGSGKTTIARALLDQIPNTRFLHSYTTRSPRSSDIFGEFTYLDKPTFESMKESDEFLWAADFGSTSVGTRIEDLERGLHDTNKIWIMVLVPEVLKKLYAFARQIDKHAAIKSVFIETECDEVLCERMTKRGDADSSIRERLDVCRSFEKHARASDIPFIWIRNNGTIQEATDAVKRAIQ